MHCLSPNGHLLKWSCQIRSWHSKLLSCQCQPLLSAHKSPIPPILIHPPSMIHLMLQEWCVWLVSVAPVHRNALPVEENLPTSVATVDFGNVSHWSAAQCSRTWNPWIFYWRYGFCLLSTIIVAFRNYFLLNWSDVDTSSQSSSFASISSSHGHTRCTASQINVNMLTTLIV